MIASRQIPILNSDHAQNHSHQNLLTAHTLHKRKHVSNQHRQRMDTSFKENNASILGISKTPPSSLPCFLLPY